MKHLKKQSYNFLKKFKITDLNVSTLSTAISQQGYTIVEYNRISNSDDVEQLLNALGVKALSLTTGAFTYADSNYRILFIEDGHSVEEQLILLAHEEGHIFCGHLNNKNNITGQDVLNEHEANTFAHYLLNRGFWYNLKLKISSNKLQFALIAISTAVALCVAAGGLFFVANNKKADSTKYCRTPYGDCYHTPNCLAVKGHTLTYGSLSDLKKDDPSLRPCSICITE